MDKKKFVHWIGRSYRKSFLDSIDWIEGEIDSENSNLTDYESKKMKYA